MEHTAGKLTSEPRPDPVMIEGVQIENINFSDAYEASIEQRMRAEVEVQKLRQNAEREKVQAQITVTQASAQADAVRARAQAEAGGRSAWITKPERGG